jgi:beta-N-acetylhexosaminidase
MTSHILFPAIDPSFPATLSRRILTGLLRNRIGFDGIIVTDCMEMRGISVGWDTGDAAVLAAEAGADIILCCHSREPQRSIRNALLAAVRSGRLSESRVDESCARIAKAKARYAVG